MTTTLAKSNESPKGWQTTTLGSLVSFEYGKGLIKNSRDTSGEVPVYGSSGIVGYHSEALTDKPCIIVGRKGAIGRVYISKVKCWPIDTTYYVEPSNELELSFVYYLLLSLRLDLHDRSTAIPGLNRDDAYAVEVAIPPFNEQNRIVSKLEELFTKLDAGIKYLKKTQILLNQYRQSILKYAFQGKLTENWRSNTNKIESGHSLLEEVILDRKSNEKEYHQIRIDKEGNLFKIPANWVWTTLGTLFDIKPGSTPSRNKKEYWHGNISWVSSSEVSNGYIYSTREKITELGLKNSSTKLNPKNTVLIAMIGEGKTRGQTAILKIPATTNQNVGAIRCNSTPIPSEFIYYWIIYQYSKNRLKGSGGMQQALNTRLVKEMTAPLPPLEEQNQIIKELDFLLSVSENIKKEISSNLSRCEMLRNVVLKSAFEGRLVPQDPSDEPAKILLERIKKEKKLTSPIHKTKSRITKARYVGDSIQMRLS